MAEILVVHVGGRQIRTTPEHEFFTCDRGKIPARDLKPGDLLPGHAGGPMPVDRIEFTGKVEPVYNVRVADFHTYFVGSPEWGFSVWAHNIYRMTVAQAEAEAMQQHAEGLASTPIPEPVEQIPGEFSEAPEGAITKGSVSQAIERGDISLISKNGAGTGNDIGATGQVGELALMRLGGESQVEFPTSFGSRIIDQLVNGVANESKVGYQSLDSEIELQIAKRLC